jgi:magnesium-transporting ATPase (P-type)
MTDASSLGSMTSAPSLRSKIDGGAWTLWEQLAAGRSEFGKPAAFNSCIAQSCWESFTVTLKNPAFFEKMTQFSGNTAGTGGLVTFKDSKWLMSIVLPHQPHFRNQPPAVQVLPSGLTSDQARRELRKTGPNTMPDSSAQPLRMAVEKFWPPVPWMPETAIVLELVLGKFVEAGIIAGCWSSMPHSGCFTRGGPKPLSLR